MLRMMLSEKHRPVNSENGTPDRDRNAFRTAEFISHLKKTTRSLVLGNMNQSYRLP